MRAAKIWSAFVDFVSFTWSLAIGAFYLFLWGLYIALVVFIVASLASTLYLIYKDLLQFQFFTN